MDLQEDAKNIKDQALKAEGEAMLASLPKPKAQILGADGRPTASVPSVDAAKKAIREEEERMGTYLRELMRKDVVINDFGEAILDMYCAMFWLILDVANQEGMNEKLANFMAKACCEAAQTKQTGIENLMSRLKNRTIPFIMKRKEACVAFEHKIKARIGRISKELLKNGVSIEDDGLRELLGKDGFRIGNTIILRGEQDVVKEAVRSLLKHHETHDKCSTVLMGAGTSELENVNLATICLPLAWWENRGNDYNKMEEVMQHAETADVTLVGCEDIGKLCEDKGRGLARLHSWCLNNAAACVAGEPSGSGAITFTGPFKRFLVTKDVSGKLVYSLVEGARKNG